jgi:DNA-directed RNA polymerase IV and V subunit 2
VEIKRDQNQREVRILSDAGRNLRSLLVVSNLLKIKGSKSEHKSFQSLLDNGVIELICREEEEDFKTAWGVQYLFKIEGKSFVKYTHCEPDMSFLPSLSCSLDPFGNHESILHRLLAFLQQTQI